MTADIRDTEVFLALTYPKVHYWGPLSNNWWLKKHWVRKLSNETQTKASLSHVPLLMNHQTGSGQQGRNATQKVASINCLLSI